MAVTASFWRGRRVLITGHTGFKGAWLATWLADLGADVVGLALPPAATPNLFEQAAVATRIDSRFGDIRDATLVAATFEETRPEIVFHLAAQALVRRSYEQPVDTFAVNVLGTTHVLEAVRQARTIRAVVIVTTDKCYENRDWSWGYRENDALGGHDPYSASKACAELVTSAYRKSYLAASSTGVASARAGNVIGGGDWAIDRIVPDLMRAALRGESALVRNPASTRPWQHVLDVLQGYLALAERLYDDPAGYSEAWNFGPLSGDVRSVADVANTLSSLWGPGASWHHEPFGQLHEARALTLDATKARHALDWRSRLSFAQALEWTASWYKAHRDLADLPATTLGQIRRFQELATP